jgi:hypothetical protein
VNALRPELLLSKNNITATPDLSTIIFKPFSPGQQRVKFQNGVFFIQRHLRRGTLLLFRGYFDFCRFIRYFICNTHMIF